MAIQFCCCGEGAYLWEQGLPAMQAPRFTKDRIAPIAGKPCSLRGNPFTTRESGKPAFYSLSCPIALLNSPANVASSWLVVAESTVWRTVFSVTSRILTTARFISSATWLCCSAATAI